MTLRHLRIFLAVCANGCNTTKAAASLNMTQPAVSLAIKELETYYGAVLFDRLGRRLSLTSSGIRFGEYAMRICSLFDDMEKNIRASETCGILRAGASITIGTQFLAGYVKAFKSYMPNIEVRAVIAPADMLEEKILLNELDFALTEGISHNSAVVSQEYMRDSLAVISPKSGAFISGQTVSAEVFQAQPILLREKGSGTREVFDRETEKNGFLITPVWESVSSQALINAVISGIGISVLPERLIRQYAERGDVNVIKVENLDFRRSFKIMYHKDKFLTPPLKSFFELCRNTDI